MKKLNLICDPETGHSKMSKNIHIKKDRKNWPLWCPICGNSTPDRPADNWIPTQKGLECMGCGCIQRWATVSSQREWLKRRRKELGAAFEAWTELYFHLLSLDLLIQSHYESLTRIIGQLLPPSMTAEDRAKRTHIRRTLEKAAINQTPSMEQANSVSGLIPDTAIQNDPTSN
jgi:hypothetical protein